MASLMCYEATRNLPTEEVADRDAHLPRPSVRVLAGKKLAIVPILRAGLGMVDGMIDADSLPPRSATSASTGIPRPIKPVKYYCKMPSDIADRDVLRSSTRCWPPAAAPSAAIDFIKEYGCKNITMMNIIAAPEGIANVTAAPSGCGHLRSRCGRVA